MSVKLYRQDFKFYHTQGLLPKKPLCTDTKITQSACMSNEPADIGVASGSITSHHFYHLNFFSVCACSGLFSSHLRQIIKMSGSVIWHHQRINCCKGKYRREQNKVISKLHKSISLFKWKINLIEKYIMCVLHILLHFLQHETWGPRYFDCAPEMIQWMREVGSNTLSDITWYHQPFLVLYWIRYSLYHNAYLRD